MTITVANDHLLVSTENEAAIQIRDLAQSAKLSHTLQTVDTPVQIVHSKVSNCLFTLEQGLPSRTPSIRAYTNWDNPRVDGAPIRPRCAHYAAHSIWIPFGLIYVSRDVSKVCVCLKFCKSAASCTSFLWNHLKTSIFIPDIFSKGKASLPEKY